MNLRLDYRVPWNSNFSRKAADMVEMRVTECYERWMAGKRRPRRVGGAVNQEGEHVYRREKLEFARSASPICFLFAWERGSFIVVRNERGNRSDGCCESAAVREARCGTSAEVIPCRFRDNCCDEEGLLRTKAKNLHARSICISKASEPNDSHL